MAKKMYNDNYLGIKDFLKINYKLFRSIMKKFKKIYIEITNICNMSCSFCPKTNRKKEFMKLYNSIKENGYNMKFPLIMGSSLEMVISLLLYRRIPVQ